jgi:hypothetical protein
VKGKKENIKAIRGYFVAFVSSYEHFSCRAPERPWSEAERIFAVFADAKLLSSPYCL